MRAISVVEISQVGEARRLAVALANDLGFSEQDSARVALVATELGTNLIKHGGGGELLVGTFEDDSGQGVECLSLDKGDGIVDLDEALQDGFSTTATLGGGLGAIVRRSDVVDIYSRPNMGTAILARLYCSKVAKASSQPVPSWGGVSIPKRGETVCGDDWSVRSRTGGRCILVADGLGHGEQAAIASRAAVEEFEAAPSAGLPLDDLLKQMHGSLHATRGAAVAVADLDRARGDVLYAGVGNIAGTLIYKNSTRRMVSHNGTIGFVLKNLQTFDYSADELSLVVLASDGLKTSWSLSPYHGLLDHHPTVIAGILYRDFTTDRDDVTVVVVRASVE